MIVVSLSAMRTFEISSPHPVDQLEPNIGQSKNNDTRDSRRDRGVHVHYEDEIVNINQTQNASIDSRARCGHTSGQALALMRYNAKLAV